MYPLTPPRHKPKAYTERAGAVEQGQHGAPSLAGSCELPLASNPPGRPLRAWIIIVIVIVIVLVIVILLVPQTFHGSDVILFALLKRGLTGRASKKGGWPVARKASYTGPTKAS